jgi:hypothetical protein
MRGGAQAHLIEADDGYTYVVKFLNNPQGHRILTNEFIASQLMQAMALSTPVIALITLPDRPLDGAALHANGRNEPAAAGVHFGSRRPGPLATCTVYDFLPDAILPEVLNREEFLGALVFDKWLSNADSRQAIFYKAHITGSGVECDGLAHWVTQFIDNGLQFQGEDWCFRDSPVQGLYGRASVYADAGTLHQFDRWFEALFALKRELIQDIIESLPVAWVVGERSQLAKTMKVLFSRREGIPGRIAESLLYLELQKHKRAFGGAQPFCRLTTLSRPKNPDYR